MKTSASGGSVRASHHACQVLLAKHFARQALRVSAGSALTCFVRCRVWQMQPQANHECQTTRVFSSLALHQTWKKLLQLAPSDLNMCLSRIPAYGPDAHNVRSEHYVSVSDEDSQEDKHRKPPQQVRYPSLSFFRSAILASSKHPATPRLPGCL